MARLRESRDGATRSVNRANGSPVLLIVCATFENQERLIEGCDRLTKKRAIQNRRAGEPCVPLQRVGRSISAERVSEDADFVDLNVIREPRIAPELVKSKGGIATPGYDQFLGLGGVVKRPNLLFLVAPHHAAIGKYDDIGTPRRSNPHYQITP